MPKIDRRKRKPAIDDADAPSVKKTKLIPMEVSSFLTFVLVVSQDDDEQNANMKLGV